MPASCEQCGYCCTVGPCPYGDWDKESGRCSFLTEENLCKKYDEIVKKEMKSSFSMFGSGCSSSLFNSVREAKIKEDLQ